MQSTEAEVEALARRMYEANEANTWGYVIPWEDRASAGSFRLAWLASARAAFAHIAEHYRLERKEA